MSELVFLLEEASAEEMLKGLLPRLLPEGLSVRFMTFEGKSDLEKHLVRRLRGYLTPNAQFIVLRDKDAGDCRAVKAGLVQKCIEAKRPNALIRIACHELENWYLADLAAVERALEIPNLSSKQGQAKFRTPDNLANAVQELERLTNHRYQKVRGSRDIGPHLDLDNTRSHSFAVFIAGLRRLIQGMQNYRIGDIAPWVKVEKYLFGTVMDMGGAQKANVHIRVEDSGQIVRIGTNQDYLKDQTENRLYRKVLVRVEADQHFRTRELRNLRLLSFEDYEPRYDEAALDRFAERGRQAWAGVSDAAEWVRQLRGGQ